MHIYILRGARGSWWQCMVDDDARMATTTVWNGQRCNKVDKRANKSECSESVARRRRVGQH